VTYTSTDFMGHGFCWIIVPKGAIIGPNSWVRPYEQLESSRLDTGSHQYRHRHRRVLRFRTSIYLGYLLFVAGASGAFQFVVQSRGVTATLLCVAPGLGFAFFEMGLAIYAVRRRIGGPPPR
jgi:hypothetical protein